MDDTKKGLNRTKRPGKESLTINQSRREFLAGAAVTGAAAGAGALGLMPQLAGADPISTGASGFEPLEVNNPMARWKKPQPITFVEQATKNYSFPNWQSGNDESIYYNLNLPEFFKCSYIAPPNEFSKLERAIDPAAMDLTFNEWGRQSSAIASEKSWRAPVSSGRSVI